MYMVPCSRIRADLPPVRIDRAQNRDNWGCGREISVVVVPLELCTARRQGIQIRPPPVKRLPTQIKQKNRQTNKHAAEVRDVVLQA